MVLDSSAIIAMLRNEPERPAFLLKVRNDVRRLTSAASFLETSMVLQGVFDNRATDRFQAFLSRFDVEIVAFDHEQAVVAREAFRRFGKGRHPAHLNLGDCMTYALAKQTGEPLLFKGNDFNKTDLLLA